jgi:hypothetical protein
MGVDCISSARPTPRFNIKAASVLDDSKTAGSLVAGNDFGLIGSGSVRSKETRKIADERFAMFA